MLIKENTLTGKGVTAVIHDTNGKGTYIYGNSFRVDKKENGGWVKPKVFMIPIIGWILIFCLHLAVKKKLMFVIWLDLVCAF